MKYGKISAAGLMVAGLMFGAPIGATAASLSCTGGSGGSAATYTLSDAVDAACFSGNDSNQIDSGFELFGLTGWVLSDKNDNADDDGAILFVDAPVIGDKSGEWSISSFSGPVQVAITLKSGNNFGAFLLDLDDLTPLSGFWSSTKGLSHASIYYNGSPQVVPLPAALPLFLAALGGLVAVGRSRKG